MIKGLYAAASAMLAGLTRQQALAHNVANMDTPGFKELLVSMDDYVDTAVVHPPGGVNNLTGLRSLGDLGLGVETAPEETDFTPGGLQFTAQPLDVAIQGPGFFRIQTPSGERYTRDGRFTKDAEGQLVTVDGYQVLDDGGQPIDLPEGPLSLLPDGTLTAGGQTVAKLGLAAFEDPAAELTRDLPNLFAAAGAPGGEELGTVSQGYLEMANVNPAELMTQMVAVTRAYEAAQRMVQAQDELLGQTISSLGRL
jgi:flagellar basal body rod protein FlgG